MKRENFDSYYENSVNRLLFRWVDSQKVTLIQKLLASEPELGKNMVELGSGNGAIAAKLSGRVTCCDYDDSLVRACREKGLEAKKVDFENPLPFKDSIASCTISIDTIDHISNPDHFLSEMKRITKKGGACIVFTPRYDSPLWVMAEKFHGMMTRRKTDHISPFITESLERRVSRIFNDYSIGSVNFGMSLYAIMRT